MGVNPSVHQGMELPVENVSWNEITRPEGFLDLLHQSEIFGAISRRIGIPEARLRLPTETEWEYAARGGPLWTEGFDYSGSNDIETVAWYERRHGDHTQPVGLKQPNQLGLYDMCGSGVRMCIRQRSVVFFWIVLPTMATATSACCVGDVFKTKPFTARYRSATRSIVNITMAV